MILSRNSSFKYIDLYYISNISCDWVKKIAVKLSFLPLPQMLHKIDEGYNNVLGREISNFLYSIFLFHILYIFSFELCKVFEESASGPINSFSLSFLFSCFFTGTFSLKRSLFFFPSVLYKMFLSFSRESFISPPASPFVARSANRPAERGQQRCSLVTVYLSRQRGAAFEQSEGV